MNLVHTVLSSSLYGRILVRPCMLRCGYNCGQMLLDAGLCKAVSPQWSEHACWAVDTLVNRYKMMWSYQRQSGLSIGFSWSYSNSHVRSIHCHTAAGVIRCNSISFRVEVTKHTTVMQEAPDSMVNNVSKVKHFLHLNQLQEEEEGGHEDG